MNIHGMRILGSIKRRALVALTTVTALSATQCRPDDPRSTQRLSTLAPVAISTGLVYVSPDRARAVRVNLTGATPTVERFRVGPAAVASVVRTGTDEVLVLSQGERGSPGIAPVAATLSVLAASGPPRVYTVGSPFNAISVTADGRFAFVHFRPSGALQRLLFNPNEVAIVDLQSAPSEGNPVRRTVRSFGGIPTDVIFSPPVAIRGEMRTIAVVVSSSYVTLMDLAHLDRGETSVRLTLPEDPRDLNPQQVLFDSELRAIYLRAAASNDVYVLRLDDAGATPAMGNDFRVSINQVGAGQGPTDLALFGEGEGRRLLVVSRGSREARVIDPRSNAITTIALDARADRALLFQGRSPRDPMTARRALLYPSRADTGSSAVSFLDLDAIEARSSQNLETVQLRRTVRFALPLPERGTVLFEHDDASTAGRLSLLDLQGRTTAPILAEVSLADARFSTDQRLLWVAPNGSPRVGFVDLRDFHPGEIRLDAPVSEVLSLPTAMGSPARVVALHPATAGSLSVLNADNPQRETTRVFTGYLAADLLDQEAQ
ncbi:MAG: hypothetical protein Q8Q09_01455 [Deltaproteobacteria bacterium]|nr:hypothetical protein [Deltaproteobacteria bacterium]